MEAPATQEESDAVVICGTSAIEPSSRDSRNRSLKTRMVKKELAATAKCSVAGVAGVELIPFNRLRSRSHCDAAAFDNHFLKRASPPSSRRTAGQAGFLE